MLEDAPKSYSSGCPKAEKNSNYTHDMLNHPTLDQLRELKLYGMADAFIELEAQDRAKELSHAKWLCLLDDRDVTSRLTQQYRRQLKAEARFF